MILADFHIHSFYSKDSRNTPKEIFRYCKQKGINCIAITDHNRLFDISTELNSQGIFVVPGEEIDTDIGELNALFISKEIQPGKAIEVLDEISKQGGISVLVHYGRKKINIPLKIMEKIDAIEVFNGRCNKDENKIAMEFNDKYKKIAIAGSDAHIPECIGAGKMEFSNFKDLKQLKDLIISGKGKVLEVYPSKKERLADMYFRISQPKKVKKILTRTIPKKIIRYIENK